MEEYFYNLTHNETTFFWTLLVIGLLFFFKFLANKIF